MKAIKKHLEGTRPERVKEFEAGASKYAKKIVANIKDYDFVSLTVSPSSPF